jgi:hypothetical protein
MLCKNIMVSMITFITISGQNDRDSEDKNVFD